MSKQLPQYPERAPDSDPKQPLQRKTWKAYEQQKHNPEPDLKSQEVTPQG